MKVFKYNIEWQFTRLKAKQEKNVAKKLEIMKKFLREYPTKENLERVKNWAEGTRIAYPKSNTEVKIFFEDFENYLEELDYKSSENSRTTDWENLKNYSEKEIMDLLKDLLGRNNKWLQDGYINDEAVAFINGLFDYLDTNYPSDQLEGLKQKHQGLLKNAKFKPYTFKWKY